ncbi:MAG: transcription elongation factor GreA, partial [Parcubacteria group bacterium]|nr:transcription elongation factor GreA [Parcubacteria group bacterium]
DKIYLSKEKYEELKKELEYLTTVRRREVAAKLEYAKSLGDLSENTEYQEAREDQAGTEERIAKVESLIRSAEIVSREAGDTISIGSRVTLEKEGADGIEVYEIVGEEESDIPQKRLSHKSPLGLVIVGKRKGDEVSMKAPTGEKRYKIINVE